MGSRINTWGYVYIIRSSNGLHKIGVAKDVNRRLKEHQRAHPSEQLDLIRTIETDNMMSTERFLHGLLDKRRVQGEWFALEPGDFAMVDLAERNIKSYIDEIR